MKTRPFHSQRGMSIVELMIAITLSLILTLGVFEIFSASKQSNRVQNALGQLQGNARFALDTISHDIRLAGQIGCNSAATITNNTGALSPFGSGVSGYEHSAAQDNLPAIMLIGDGGNPDGDDVKDGTDVIFLRYAAPVSLSVSSATSTNITLTADHEIPSNTPLIISDCESSDVFIAGDVDDDSIDIGTGTFSKIYGADAELAQLVYRAYYIGEGTNTLYRSDVVSWNGGGSISVQKTPILEGFEISDIQYGVDINGDGSAIKYTDGFTVSGSNEWNQVSSVRLTLVLSTEEKNVAITPQSYWLNGARIALQQNQNPDNKIFRSFTTTIKLRNKGLGL